MSHDALQKDHRQLRIKLVLAAVALLIALLLAAMRVYQSEWRNYQSEFKAQLQHRGGRLEGIQQISACTGEVDRCPTCHLAIHRNDLDDESLELPFKGHSSSLRGHRPDIVGCTSCHGGNGRALTVSAAHGLTEGEDVDPSMTEPYLQANCVRCHVPGSHEGQERLVEGANLYLGLGCAVCHPLTNGGRGGWDYGPDLKMIGRKSLAYLEASLMDPKANFPDSTMPSFRLALDGEERAVESLMIFLKSLVLKRASECNSRTKSLGAVKGPCANCHDSTAGKASGRFVHGCPYLLDRKDQLRCGNCHPQQVPRPGAGKGYCPAVKGQRTACSACHDED